MTLSTPGRSFSTWITRCTPIYALDIVWVGVFTIVYLLGAGL